MVIRRRTGCTARTGQRTVVAVWCATALVLSGCTGGDALGSGDAATVAEGSAAEFKVAEGQWSPADAGTTIPDGAQVRAAEDEVELTFRNGTVRLTEDAAATVSDNRVALERGEALVASSGGLSVALDDTTVAGAGRFRVASGLAAEVGVYEGSVAVRRPVQQRSVGALRELDLTAFRLAASPRPLGYQEDDAWDRELLGDAIAFDGEAARLLRGLDVELGTRPLPTGFYRRFTQRDVVPVLARAAQVSRRDAFGPPSDAVLTLSIAQAAAEREVRPVVRQVARLRTDGARWGLIALELGAASDEVVAAIDDIGGQRLARAGAQARERLRAIAAAQQGADGAQLTAAIDPAAPTASTTVTGGGGDEPPSGGTREPTSNPPPPDDPEDPDDPGDDDPATVVDGVVTTVDEAASGNLPLDVPSLP